MIQQFYRASDADGGVKEFFWPIATSEGREQALAQAEEYAQSQGGYGAVLLMERERLNDFVGPPVWSEPRVVHEM